MQTAQKPLEVDLAFLEDPEEVVLESEHDSGEPRPEYTLNQRVLLEAKRAEREGRSVVMHLSCCASNISDDRERRRWNEASFGADSVGALVEKHARMARQARAARSRERGVVLLFHRALGRAARVATNGRVRGSRRQSGASSGGGGDDPPDDGGDNPPSLARTLVRAPLPYIPAPAARQGVAYA